MQPKSPSSGTGCGDGRNPFRTPSTTLV
jgi:hypothetical protein